MIVLEVLCVVFGVVIVFLVLSAAVRTVVVPRDEQVFLNRLVFRITRVCFEMFAKESRPYKDRDRVMALRAHVADAVAAGLDDRCHRRLQRHLLGAARGPTHMPWSWPARRRPRSASSGPTGSRSTCS